MGFYLSNAPCKSTLEHLKTRKFFAKRIKCTHLGCVELTLIRKLQVHTNEFRLSCSLSQHDTDEEK